MKYRARRHMTDYLVDLRWGDGERTAEIVDVTADGARLFFNEMPALFPGLALSMETRGGTMEATVVWATDPEAGIAFRSPLPDALLRLLTRSSVQVRGGRRNRFLMS